MANKVVSATKLCQQTILQLRRHNFYGRSILCQYSSDNGDKSKGEDLTSEPTGTTEDGRAGSSQQESSQHATPSQYNAPEYFNYNPMSFYDIELNFQKHRLPQPSSRDKMSTA